MNQLIVVIVNQGYEELVMSSARACGARGGTIFNGRGTAQAQDLINKIGITVHPNKEIILILTSLKDRDKIMNGIKETSGLTTKGAGILFSLPVDTIMGVTLSDNIDKNIEK